jgi:8-oxo-dGTP pyrophosphatase MutT (NUDIX family)
VNDLPLHRRAELPPWLAELHRRANLPPRAARDPLILEPAGVTIGSIERAVAERLAREGLPLCPANGAWRAAAPGNESLAEIALALERAGLGGRWRDELLDVTAEGWGRVAMVERGAVRALGISTFAVHLIGVRGDGRVWVQQRAFDKATDPGLWDTTMGGQVGAGETTAQTLERETWEEAGLRRVELQNAAFVQRLDVRRPVREGYMVEQIAVFEASLADAVVPRNQDGEVHCFECLAPDELRARIEADAFTLEAALILAAWLSRRGHL